MSQLRWKINKIENSGLMVESDSEKESLYIEQKFSAWSYVPEKN
jgi:hypothetical protein